MATPSLLRRLTTNLLLVSGLVAASDDAMAQREKDILRLSGGVGYNSFLGAGAVAHKPFSVNVNADIDRVANTPFGFTLSAKKYLVGGASSGGMAWDVLQINPAESHASVGASLRGGVYHDMRDGGYFLGGLFMRNQFMLNKKQSAANDKKQSAPSSLQDIGAYFGFESDRINFRVEASVMLNKVDRQEVTVPNGTVLPAGKGNAPFYMGATLGFNFLRRGNENQYCSPTF